jgi:hypothetical protein
MRADSKRCRSDGEFARSIAPRARQIAPMKCVAAPSGLCFFYVVRGANDQRNSNLLIGGRRAISSGA